MGLLLHVTFNSGVKFRSESLFCCGILHCHTATWLSDCSHVLLDPFLFISPHHPTFTFVFDVIQGVASSYSLGKV